MTGERGFTMLEVLVTLALFGLAMLGFLQTSLLSARLYDRSRMRTEALLMAEERMEMVKSRGWEEATADCTDDIPAEMEMRGLQRTVVSRGVRYCLVHENIPAGPALVQYRITCFWAPSQKQFSRANRISLTSAERGIP